MESNFLFIRLYLDEDVHPDFAELIRQDGFECVSAHEVGMVHKDDPEQLQFAASQGWCILTFNVGDFMRLAGDWAQAGRPHAGILVAQQVSKDGLRLLRRKVVQLLNKYTADEVENVAIHL